MGQGVAAFKRGGGGGWNPLTTYAVPQSYYEFDIIYLRYFNK